MKEESHTKKGPDGKWEETGLKIDNVTFVRDYENTKNYLRSINKVFAATPRTNEVSVDGLEIKEAQWFPLDSLPDDRVPRVDENLNAYKKRFIRAHQITHRSIS